MDHFDFGFEVKKGDILPDGTFKGIGSPFLGPPDGGGDVIRPGSFIKTISSGGPNGSGIWPFLWHHDVKDPIGIIAGMGEKKVGLDIEGQYALEASRGHDAYILAKMGACVQLSMGYKAEKEEIDYKKNIRYLDEIKLREFSQVTFGMAGSRASIRQIKSIEQATTVREVEHILREEGLSRSAAKWVAGLIRPQLRDAEGEEGKANGFDDVLATLRQARADAQIIGAFRLNNKSGI